MIMCFPEVEFRELTGSSTGLIIWLTHQTMRKTRTIDQNAKNRVMTWTCRS